MGRKGENELKDTTPADRQEKSSVQSKRKEFLESVMNKSRRRNKKED